MRPILSIVIPTKNRYEYLVPCISSLLNLKSKCSDMIEIVVSDNSDNNEYFLSSNNRILQNIKYIYTKENISVVDNSRIAVEQSSGEYVCFIGDDDSVADAIVDVTKWAKANNIESILGGIVRYNWPDLVSASPNLKTFSVPSYKEFYHVYNPMELLNETLEDGAVSMGNLPKVYHGIVSREALDRLKQLSGSYFPGPSPDMANAIGLCCVLKNHIRINNYIIVSGFSIKSTGGMGARHKHVGEISEISHLPKNTIDEWEKENPRYWTGSTIYAESAIKALKSCGMHSYIKKFNYAAVYGSLVAMNPELLTKTLPYITIKNIVPFIWYFIKIINLRFCYLLKNKFRKSTTINTSYVSTLDDAIKETNNINELNNLTSKLQIIKL